MERKIVGNNVKNNAFLLLTSIFNFGIISDKTPDKIEKERKKTVRS